MVTISAQPMLQPSLSQPGINFQASHLPLKIILMPQDDEASTQSSVQETGGGLANDEPAKSVAS